MGSISELIGTISNPPGSISRSAGSISYPAAGGITPAGALAPTASSVTFTGTLTEGQTLTGSYSYSDPQGLPQSGSTYIWYRANDAIGTGSAPIVGATALTYILQAADVSKYIRFGVVPRNGFVSGSEAFSAWTGPVASASVIESDFQLGSVITDAYQGDTFTAADNTRWLANTTTAPFAYTSDYAGTPTALLCPHPLITGPMGNGLWEMQTTATYAYKASGTISCITGARAGGSIIEGDATNGYIYYTSTNGGSSWTRRTLPNTKSYSVGFTAGLFVGFSQNPAANGIITSTDAVTWSSLTGASSQDNASDIVSNGSTQIVIFSDAGTKCNVSVDSGATWAEATITAPGLNTSFNQGGCTYNAGAGLFIGNVGTAGRYQTSPTGETWTLRSTIATYLPYGTLFGTTCRYASNATVTVAIATNGFFATTTDGLVWANHGFIVGTGPRTTLIDAIYYDGTRFVATGATSGRIFYSTNGTTWTEGRPAPAEIVIPSNDRHLRILGTVSAVGESKALIVTDPTSTTAQTVTSLTQGAAQAATNNYTRIL